jgi:hypothetical protein
MTGGPYKPVDASGPFFLSNAEANDPNKAFADRIRFAADFLETVHMATPIGEPVDLQLLAHATLELLCALAWASGADPSDPRMAEAIQRARDVARLACGAARDGDNYRLDVADMLERLVDSMGKGVLDKALLGDLRPIDAFLRAKAYGEVVSWH